VHTGHMNAASKQGEEQYGTPPAKGGSEGLHSSSSCDASQSPCGILADCSSHRNQSFSSKKSPKGYSPALSRNSLSSSMPYISGLNLDEVRILRKVAKRSAKQRSASASNASRAPSHARTSRSSKRTAARLRHSVSTPALYSLTSVAPWNGSFHQYSKRYKVQQSSGYGVNPDWKPYDTSRVEIHNDKIPNWDRKVKPTYSRKVPSRSNTPQHSVENNPIPNWDKRIKSVYDGTHIMSKPKKSKVKILNEPIPDYKRRIRPVVPSHKVTHRPRTSFGSDEGASLDRRLSLNHVKPVVPSHKVTHRPRPSTATIHDDKSFSRKMRRVPPTVPSHVVKYKPKPTGVNVEVDHCYRDELELYRGVERDAA